MKFVLAAAVAIATTPALAAEIGATGITVGGEANTEYNVDAENLTFTFTPEVGYAWNDFAFSASTELAVYDDEIVLEDTFETLPTLDFSVERPVFDSMTAYAEVSYDLEAEERGDLVVGATFSF